MEQHPVPRNITGFQFRLVGDMTLKQFGYLAAGVILAYLIYKFPLPQIFSLPLAGITALIGFAFAFLPIQERPLDRWLIAFIKSIYSPTQYIWRKQNPPLALLLKEIGRPLQPVNRQQNLNHQIANEKLKTYLSTLPQTLDKTVSLREKAYLDKTLALFGNSSGISSGNATYTSPPTTTPPTTTYSPPAVYEKINVTQTPPESPSKPTVKKTLQVETSAPVSFAGPKTEDDIVRRENEITKKSLDLEKTLQNQNVPNEHFLELEQKLNDLLQEKEKLTQELTTLRMEKNVTRQTPVKPIKEEGKPSAPTVRTISSASVKNLAGMPSVPTVGNIIIGVIRDNLQRLLPGIIVTVKDLTDMPLRALKTNKLGQFAAATPLTNGNYIIEVEDPQGRFRFDLIEITLDGNVFMPIEIIAKGEREILRDKLTKELFGNEKM